jgi:kumamolisin
MPNREQIRGSERSPLPGARVLGPADTNERLEVTVRVRPRSRHRFAAIGRELMEPREAPSARMTRDDFEQVHGADAEDLNRVEQFAKAHGLAVLERSAARRSIVLGGTVGQFSDAFGVTLQTYEHAAGTYRVGPAPFTCRRS